MVREGCMRGHVERDGVERDVEDMRDGVGREESMQRRERAHAETW